jgi:poly-gamma-glutamate capsule biosynthesis protein CapA/YwtB (metallophosphatase superfamily)
LDEDFRLQIINGERHQTWWLCEMKKNLQKTNLFSAIVGLMVLFLAGCQSESVANNPVLESQMPKFAQSTPTVSPTPQVRKEKTISIAAVGDMMIGSPYPTDDRMPPNDARDMFKLVEPVLSKADIAFGNLEGSLLDDGDSAKCKPNSKTCYAFRMPTRYGVLFKNAGFDVVSAANNHAGDFGEVGRASTRRVLDGLGIKHAGSDSGVHSTTYVEVDGTTVAFIGFTTNGISLNLNNLTAASNAVKKADIKADIVVVSFHGGAEGANAQNVPFKTEMFYGEKRGNLRLFARTVIDAGADLVIGHGPHVLRGMEIYNDRLIAYSLGNFATYGWFRLMGPTRLTAILETNLDSEGKLVSGTIHSGKQIDWGVPALDPSGAAINKIRTLSNADFGKNAPLISADGRFSKQ